MMLKIYSDPQYVPEGKEHTIMLFPFWGKTCENPGSPLVGRFDNYTQKGRDFFEMTVLQDADVAIAPTAWETSDVGRILTRQLVEEATQAGKPTAIFYHSDFDEPIALDNTIIFRTSLLRSRRAINEFAIPAWSEDFVTRHCSGELPVRPKSTKPIVGFCGAVLKPQADLPALQSLKISIKHMISPPPLIERQREIGYGLRSRAIKMFETNDAVDTNFILRERWFAGANAKDKADAHTSTVRAEYVQNMLGSDYTLCMRGMGNFSFRLYETLSCGRIPVFIDTDCVLPFDFIVDWKDYCVWIDESELKNLPEKVAEFHEALSDQDFVDLQYECRKLWENWIRPEGFFANFHHHLEANLP